MTEPRKRTPAETWKALEDLAGSEEPAGGDEIDRVLALSDEELDRELVASGFDASALRAHGEQIGSEAARASVEQAGRDVAARSAGHPPKSRARTTWLLAVALVAVVVIAVRTLAFGPGHIARSHSVGASVPAQEELARAREMRSAAGVACGAERWRECLERLEAARPLDPEGDTAEAVQAQRARAQAGLAARPSP